MDIMEVKLIDTSKLALVLILYTENARRIDEPAIRKRRKETHEATNRKAVSDTFCPGFAYYYKPVFASEWEWNHISR